MVKLLQKNRKRKTPLERSSPAVTVGAVVAAAAVVFVIAASVGDCSAAYSGKSQSDLDGKCFFMLPSLCRKGGLLLRPEELSRHCFLQNQFYKYAEDFRRARNILDFRQKPVQRAQTTPAASTSIINGNLSQSSRQSFVIVANCQIFHPSPFAVH
jgi:hypothetical protein